MIKLGTQKHAIWTEYTAKIKALREQGNMMEAAILMDVRTVLCESRPKYMKGWSVAQIEAHSREFHESIAAGTHPFVGSMEYA